MKITTKEEKQELLKLEQLVAGEVYKYRGFRYLALPKGMISLSDFLYFPNSDFTRNTPEWIHIPSELILG